MMGLSSISEPLAPLLTRLRGCRICLDGPLRGSPLPHEPRPILQAGPAARLCIASQAPGARAHRSGIPFQDPSGTRLRDWLALDEPTFYDSRRVAIVPMGCCFPGHDALGGDLPPRRECAEAWRRPLLAALPALELILLVGAQAQAWHLGREARAGLTATVERWREILAGPARPRLLPLPHPSWRNSSWLKRHGWFEAELLPVLRAEVAALTSEGRVDRPTGRRDAGVLAA